MTQAELFTRWAMSTVATRTCDGALSPSGTVLDSDSASFFLALLVLVALRAPL